MKKLTGNAQCNTSELWDIQHGCLNNFGQPSMPDKSDSVLTFDGKRYEMDSLTQETQELIRGVRVADSQLKFHEDTLKVIALGRQALALKLKANLASATTITP